LARQHHGVASRTVACLLGGFLAAFLTHFQLAIAFPFVDPTNADTLPTGAPAGTELPATDITGLQNQLRLTNPAAMGTPGGWTIIPRLTLQEMFTDNALEATSPRRFDAITVIAPGISAIADTARLQLHLDYQPNVLLHAINGPLNVMTQQLNATGLVTVVPDLAFVDLRALSGVQSRYGALAGAGTIGNGNAGLTSATAAYGGGGQIGTNPSNEVQTSSVGMSPYLLGQFKDYGTGKLGASLNASHYSTISGFAANPFPTGGTNAQSLLATEQIAQFTTGEFLGRLQSVFLADFLQSRTQADTGATVQVTTPQGTTTTVPVTSFTSQRQTITDQLSYQLNRTFALLASIGEQRIQYTGTVGPQVNGLTWKAGLTVTPNPDSSLTVTYGHFNGVDGFQANGHLALGGRTLVSFDYSNTVGTQLENLQNQLNNSALNINGQLVNAVTGGPNFVATNALGVQTGVFRYSTLNAALATTWLRDTLQANATWSIQTNLTPGNVQSAEFIDPATGNVIIISQPAGASGQSTDIKTASLTWTHALSPALTLNSSASYSFIRRSGGLGNDNSLAAAVGLQYALSASTTLSARYSFFDRVSTIPGYSVYENILLVGFTKQF
jgi:hypothetical protein